MNCVTVKLLSHIQIAYLDKLHTANSAPDSGPAWQNMSHLSSKQKKRSTIMQT